MNKHYGSAKQYRAMPRKADDHHEMSQEVLGYAAMATAQTEDGSRDVRRALCQHLAFASSLDRRDSAQCRCSADDRAEEQNCNAGPQRAAPLCVAY